MITDALACYRLTRLLVRDDLTAPLRVRAAERGPEKLAIMLDCPFCAGFWIALGVVAARRLAPKTWQPVAEVLALSAVVGLVAEHLD